MKVFQSSVALFALAMIVLSSGCDRLDMYDQPRYEPLEASRLFADGRAARQPVEGTIPRGGLCEDEAFFTGKLSGKPVNAIPDLAYRTVFQQTPKRFTSAYEETLPQNLRHALMKRGRDRYEIYCSVCHGRTGDGRGMIVQRGFRQPPNYTVDRLRSAPDGHFFDVISNGFGAMASYANRIDAGDRWAIVAYIRALQLSQHADFEEVPDEHRTQLASSSESEKPSPEKKETTP